MGTYITPSLVAKETLIQLRNHMVFGNLVHREFKKEFLAKTGGAVTIRKPVKFAVVKEANVTGNVNTIVEGNVTFNVDQWRSVPMSYSSTDKTLSIEDFSKRYITPAAIVLANEVDISLANLYQNVFNAAGTAGITPASFAALGAAAQKLDEGAVPRDTRRLVLDPAANWSLADNLKGLFLQNRVDDMVGEGYLATLAGMKIHEDQNIARHTVGAAKDDTSTLLVCTGSDVAAVGIGGNTYVTSSAVANTSTLYVDGFNADTAGALAAGDIFTVANDYAVNPVSKVTTGQLQQFTVVTDVTPGTNAASVTVSPAIVSSGAYQQQDSLPIDGAAITLYDSHVANLAFHRNAFGLVFVPIELPDGAPWRARESHEGLSVMVTKDWDVLTTEETLRVDILYGVKCLYPELACRLLG